MAPRHSTTLLFTRDPGFWVVIAGAVLSGLCLFFGLSGSHDRYWYVWRPGRVTVIGWSNKPILFGPRFAVAMESFKARMGRADKSLRQLKLEVSHG